MIRTYRSIVVRLVAAAVFAVSLIGASAASAQTELLPGDAGVVVFTGEATNTTIPAPPATGGSGTFSFSGQAAGCTWLSLPDDLGEFATLFNEVGSCTTIRASGTFGNIICGTGTASGRATLSTSEGYLYFDFTIAFVHGVGVLVASNASTRNPFETNDNDTGGGGAAIAVLSNVNDNQPPQCTGPTSGFQVSGLGAIAVLEGSGS
jgi:hypothetical protein